MEYKIVDTGSLRYLTIPIGQAVWANGIKLPPGTYELSAIPGPHPEKEGNTELVYYRQALQKILIHSKDRDSRSIAKRTLERFKK